MKAKEWLKKNVDFRRDEAEVRENKGYYATMTAAGLIVGAVTGILVVILQFAVSGHEAQQKWISAVSVVAIVAMIAFLIYMLLPMFKDSKIEIGSKILTTLACIACLIIPFIVGIYAVILVFMALAALAALWLALKIWGSSSSTSSSSYQAPQERNDRGQITLEDGTVLTENSLGSGYHGNDYHNYERNSDGSFSRTD